MKRAPLPSSRIHGNRGFTLLELLVTVVMLGILLSYASLNTSAFLAQYRLRGAARQVATDLRLARTKAITETWSYRVVFTNGARSYTVQRSDGSGGWVEHVLHAKTTTAPGSPQPVALPEPVSIAAGATVVFTPRGNTTTNPIVIRLRDPGFSTQPTIDVRWSGQVSMR